MTPGNARRVAGFGTWRSKLGWVALATALLWTTAFLQAQDAPHALSCSSCHIGHFAFGDQFDSLAGNANLCLSCHVEGGCAWTKPMTPLNQAVPWPGVGANTTGQGTSHRWDAGPGGRVVILGDQTASGERGLLTFGTYTGRYAGTFTINIISDGSAGTARFNWSSTSPGGGSGTNLLTGFWVPLTNGLVVSFQNYRPNPAFKTADTWQIYVRPDLSWPSSPDLEDLMDVTKLTCSTCHDQHSQARTPFDPAAPDYQYSGTGSGRHFMRIDNNHDQMCRECHGARFVTNSASGSHPVGMLITSNSFYHAPSSLPLDKALGQMSCSTCHQVHYSANADGSLLRATNQNSLCFQCHSLASLATAGIHLNLTNGAAWPGGQYGSLFPGVSSSQRGQCGNCHQSHGWPDPSSPTNDYPTLLVEKEENLCYTCHDGSPVAKNVRVNFARTYTHPVTLSGRHSLKEQGTSANYGTANRHAECADCHDPHALGKDATTPAPPLASHALRSVPRVSVNNLNTNSVTYIFRGADDPTPAREYELCFTCHSSWTTQPAGQANYAAKFNTFNASFHPVEAQGNNLTIAASAFTNGWSAAKMMFCGDCHTSDDSTIRGPHGSSFRYILKKNYTPNNTSSLTSSDLCFDCHSYSTYTSTSSTAKAGTRWRGAGDYSKHIHASKNCYGCHDTHSATTNSFLIATGTGRDLISYTRTGSGGTCVGRSGCHSSHSYTAGYAR